MKGSQVLVVIILLLVVSCKKDDKHTPVCEDGSSPTYNDDIKSIITSTCNSAGCHSSGSSNGDYTSYSGLSIDLNNGRFESRVLIDQTMPRGTSFSDDELNLLQCWLENDFAED